MSVGSSQDTEPASSEPLEAPNPGARSPFEPILLLGVLCRETGRIARRLLSGLWSTLPSYLPFYVIVAVAGYAIWEARTPVTIIAPFQLPRPDLPFSGDIVADSLQDALTSIQSGGIKDRHDPRLRSSEVDLTDLRTMNVEEWRNMLIPKFRCVQGPARFAVEVQGWSYEGIISLARSVVGTETTVSGDVILSKNEFILIARTADAGPWESIPSPLTSEGLKQASRDLAEKILATLDPTFAGVALLEDGQVDQGLAALERAQSLNPGDAGLKLNLCMGFGASRRYGEAKKCYQDALKMNPSSPQEVSERLAQAYYLNGDRDDAVKLFEELAHKQGYKRALLALAEALDDTGHRESAQKVYNEFLGAEVLDQDLAIALTNQGAVLAHSGRHDEALADYRKALQYVPGDPLILANIGVELAKAGDLDGGIAQLQSVVDEKVNTDSIPFAFLQLGALFQKKGDWQRAGDACRKATELRPSYVEAHLHLAYILAHEGQLRDSLSEYNRVAKLSPQELDRTYSQVFANQWLGNALRDQGQYAAAASAYREAIRLEPNYRAAHCELGFVLERQRHLSEAIQEYRLAVVAKSNDLNRSEKRNESLVLAHRRLGEALLSNRRAHHAEGIAELRQALELDDGKRLESYLGLGQALYDQGSFADAASVYNEAIQVAPKSAAAFNYLARALEKEGLVEQAALKSRVAVQLEPDNTCYRIHLARELELQHLSQEAAAERETVAKLNSAAREVGPCSRAGTEPSRTSTPTTERGVE